MFADNTAGLDCDSDLNVLVARVNSELKNIARWF
jgi:hypothetical protein